MTSRRFALFALALAPFLASCSTVSGDAATVNGKSISQADFETMLGEYAAGVNGALDSNGTVLGSVARGFLTDWIGTQVLDSALSADGVEIDDESLTTARQQLELQAGFADVGAATQDFYVFATAVRNVFLATHTIDEDEARSIYEQGAGSSGFYCLRGILTDDRAGIDEVAARLAFGAEFAEVAVDYSADPSSAPNGGILSNTQTGDECLGALDFESGSDPTLVGALIELGVGEISEPIELSSGKWVVITIRPFDEVADEISSKLSLAPAEEARDRAFESVSVSVSSRYGRWDPVTGSVVDLVAG